MAKNFNKYAYPYVVTQNSKRQTIGLFLNSISDIRLLKAFLLPQHKSLLRFTTNLSFYKYPARLIPEYITYIKSQET